MSRAERQVQCAKVEAPNISRSAPDWAQLAFAVACQVPPTASSRVSSAEKHPGGSGTTTPIVVLSSPASMAMSYLVI
jgi:hypothetical protein